MENVSTFPYLLLSTATSVASETRSQTQVASSIDVKKEAMNNIIQPSTTSLIVSADMNGLSFATAANSGMSGHLMKEDGDTVPLTAVPVVFTSEGHVNHILDMGMLTGSEQTVTGKHVGEGVSVSSTTQTGSVPVLFQTSSGCTIDMLNTVTDVKPDMALLQVQPVHESKVSSTVSPVVLSKTQVGFANDMLASQEIVSDSETTKSITSLQSSIEIRDVNRTVADLPVVLSGNNLILTTSSQDKSQEVYVDNKTGITETEKVLCDDVNTATSVPVVLKPDSGVRTFPMALSEPGESLDVHVQSSTGKKSEMSPSTVFQEGAVLVETPQGLMLSVGNELRAVTLTEEPDSQGNHLLSISNNCIPVALLSQCQQGGLSEEQSEEVVYEGTGEGGTGAEGPILCPTELPIVTQQVLTVSTPEEEEPKKKNRGWPKGKKRKSPPQVHGPRAPMTGYVLFAINRRQEIKRSHPHLPFTEVTKVLGQEWSSMPLDKKQKYLDEAENDKQRYIDELKQFQKSEMYQTLVKKKRLKDDDTADDLGDDMEEDSDELHCKVCKLYFSSLHNKKEHLLGKQHLQAITDQLKKELKKQEKEQMADMRGGDPLVSMELGPIGSNAASFSSDLGDGPNEQCGCQANKPVDISSFIMDFMHKNTERDQEILTLKRILRKNIQENWSICKQIQELKDYETKLRQDQRNLAAHTAIISGRINTLKMVPAMFGIEDF